MPRQMQWLVQRGGVGELYRGLYATLVTLSCANFLYFFFYNGFKHIVQARSGRPTVGPLLNLVIASFASIINVTLTAPLWVLCTKVKADDKAEYHGSMLHCLRSVVRKSGVRSLWSGLIPALWLVSNPVVQYFTYERLRIFVAATLRTGSQLRGVDFFLIGALAKAAATVTTYPLQVVQVLSYKSHKSMLACFSDAMRANGLRGLYKGMGAKLTQTVLNAAFMCMFYEKLKAILMAMFLRG